MRRKVPVVTELVVPESVGLVEPRCTHCRTDDLFEALVARQSTGARRGNALLGPQRCQTFGGATMAIETNLTGPIAAIRACFVSNNRPATIERPAPIPSHRRGVVVHRRLDAFARLATSCTFTL